MNREREIAIATLIIVSFTAVGVGVGYYFDRQYEGAGRRSMIDIQAILMNQDRLEGKFQAALDTMRTEIDGLSRRVRVLEQREMTPPSPAMMKREEEKR